MGKLTDYLKSESKQPQKRTKKKFFESKTTFLSGVVSSNTEGLEFDISDEDLETVRASVVNIDTNGKNRKQIIIGMFGGIKNPKTGKRFVIPSIDFSDEDYTYRYAEMMRTLVNRPNDFKKIMNWE